MGGTGITWVGDILMKLTVTPRMELPTYEYSVTYGDDENEMVFRHQRLIGNRVFTFCHHFFAGRREIIVWEWSDHYQIWYRVHKLDNLPLQERKHHVA